jgi:hypothetical protein
MPRDKDRKRIIRERMKKTGESYTAARAHVLSKQTADRPAAPVRDLGALAGMTDAAVAAKTGRTWRQWVDALDADGAAAMTHRDIAAMLHSKHHVGDWWAQTVTVGYERIKGLRERGQRRNGTYEATKSRTYNVPVAALFDAWADHASRRRWLDGVEPVVRTATKAEVDAPAMAGRHARRRRVHGERSEQERRRARAHAASRPGGVRQSERGLGGTTHRARLTLGERVQALKKMTRRRHLAAASASMTPATSCRHATHHPRDEQIREHDKQNDQQLQYHGGTWT